MKSVLPSFRARDRRALLVGALVILPSVALSRGIPLANEWQKAAGNRLRALQSESSNARAQIAEHLLTGADTSFNVRRIEELRDLIFSASSVPSGAADLADYLNSMCGALGIEIRSMTPRGDTAFIAGVARTGLLLALSTDTQGLFSLLGELEAGPRRVSIRTLNVTQRSPAAGISTTETLSVELIVEATVQRLLETDA